MQTEEERQAEPPEVQRELAQMRDLIRDLTERLDLEEIRVTDVLTAFETDPNLQRALVGKLGTRLPNYTVAELPVGPNRGDQAYVTDEVGGEIPVFADAAGVWRRVSDRAVAS